MDSELGTGRKAGAVVTGQLSMAGLLLKRNPRHKLKGSVWRGTAEFCDTDFHSKRSNAQMRIAVCTLLSELCVKVHRIAANGLRLHRKALLLLYVAGFNANPDGARLVIAVSPVTLPQVKRYRTRDL